MGKRSNLRNSLRRLTQALPVGARLGRIAAWAGLGAAVLTAACAGDSGEISFAPSEASAGDPWAVAEVGLERRWLPILATQDLAVGVKRIAFTLDGLGALEEEPQVRTSLFRLDGSEADRERPTLVQYARFIPHSADAEDGIDIAASHGHGSGGSVSDRALPIGRGIYVAPLRLTEAGLWGLLFEMDGGGETEEARLRFSVRDRPDAPAVGDQAPPSQTPTMSDVDSLAQISTDRRPEPALYRWSIAAALGLGRPLVVVFATPAFCHSRTCGPVLEAVKTVWRERPTELTAIHVEVFENPTEPERLRESAAFRKWRLPSEPWVFVIDRDGIIRYRFEGTATEAELRSAADWVIQDGAP